MRNLLIILAFGLLGCATAPTTPASKPLVQESDRLAPGDCGLFGWTADAARSYVFFATESEATLALDGTPQTLTPKTAFPAVEYADTSGSPVILALGPGEAMAGGTRYPTASLTVKTQDGWDKVVPVAIVESCQG